MPDPSTQPQDTVLEFTGDRVAADLLRESLRALAQRYAGHPLGRQIEDVLSGRTSMRELADDPEFASLAHEGMRRFAQDWRALNPEQRAALMAGGDQP